MRSPADRTLWYIWLTWVASTIAVPVWIITAVVRGCTGYVGPAAIYLLVAVVQVVHSVASRRWYNEMKRMVK